MSILDFANRFFQSKKFRLGLVVVILIVPFVYLSCNHDKLANYLVTGGVLGAVSSIVVIVDIVANKRESAFTLLHWRAVADLGVAVRFIFTYQWNSYVCGDPFCSIQGRLVAFCYPLTLVIKYNIQALKTYIAVDFRLHSWNSLKFLQRHGFS